MKAAIWKSELQAMTTVCMAGHRHDDCGGVALAMETQGMSWRQRSQPRAEISSS